MKCSASCLFCILKRQEEALSRMWNVSEDRKSEFVCDVLKLLGERGQQESAPQLLSRISLLSERAFGRSTGMAEQKQYFNRLLLKKENQFRDKIRSSPDPLLEALRLASAGNYIDFGAMKTVDEDKLTELLDQAAGTDFLQRTLPAFKEELASARHIAYCTDNCGEIVLDKLLIETILGLYPRISIKAVVRGKPVINDATLEDARQVGLTDVVTVIGNGTAIPGTQLEAVNRETSAVLCRADMIISKGQGNFETLYSSGLNIYYLFLCKCSYFAEKFGMNQYEGVFVRERELRDTARF